jgi:pimeloyl-ACP methyl ester carboxylesterase
VRVPRTIVVSGCLALLSACTGGASSGYPAGFAEAPCPADVEVQLLVRHSCGYLTVPEDRTRPAGRTLSLFVVTITPPSTRTDPVLILGDDIGALPDYGAHQAEAERLHRVVYLMDQRGVGHSGPELSCPEVDRASTRGLMQPTGSASLARDSLAAVTACRARLVASGIAPEAYDLSGMTADVEDLRTTLGIDAWNVAAYGSLTRLAFEVIREHADHVRAAYLDSPQFPELDEPTEAAIGTGLMLDALFGACDADAACRSSYPDLRGAWDRAISGLAAHPIHAGTEFGDVLVDAGSFVRGVQADLSEDTAEVPGFPSMVLGAGSGRLPVEMTTVLAEEGTLCAGYRVSCGVRFSTGVYLSVLCRDQAPFVDPSWLRDTWASTPGLTDAFGANPYLSACPVWNVPPGTPSVHAPVRGTVPMLMVLGQFDPFSPPRLAHELSEALDTSFRIEVPAKGHAPLLVGGCQLEIRDRWLDHPSSPPTGTSCLDGQRLEFLPPP